MAALSIAGATRRYADHAAVNDVSLHIDKGELVALLGPSGCGKTTLLRLIAGFERLDAGVIAFDGETIAGDGVHLPPERRRVGMVFQAYALWPHMSVDENVGYPLRVRSTPRQERDARVSMALAQVGMAELGHRRPADLSGGQRQRVALARCLAMEPTMVLLDEPLASLDVHLRETMQAEFRAFHASTGATMVYVTHDQAEAMALADRIAVMNNGRIEQVAAPRTLYDKPATAMVAQFVGRGMVVPATVLATDGPGYVTAQLLGAQVQVRADDQRLGPTQMCLRAERLLACLEPAAHRIGVEVRDVTYRGPVSTLHTMPTADAKAGSIDVEVRGDAPAPGERIYLEVEDAWCIPASKPGDG